MKGERNVKKGGRKRDEAKKEVMREKRDFWGKRIGRGNEV